MPYDMSVYAQAKAMARKAPGQTHADQIRALTDEELAKFLFEYGGSSPNCNRANMEADNKTCDECWLEWLKQPAESEGEA